MRAQDSEAARPEHDDEESPALARTTLMGSGTRVVLYPELGGKIGALEMGDRQWLWTSDVIPFRRPVEGSSYVETADSGGFDECFPTVGPCTLPTEAGAFAGVHLPDHGELWSQRCALDARDATAVEPASTAALCTWRTRHLPALFERTLRILEDGAVVLDYRATNLAPRRLPFLWSAHPLLPLLADAHIALPEGARMRVWAAHRIDVADGEHRWPEVRLRDGSVFDASRPGLRNGRWAMKLFLDVDPDGEGAIGWGGTALSCAWQGTTHFGLWLNHRGWTPFDGAEPYLNLAFEPCIGAPDSLAGALGSWQSAAWLEEGEVRTWSLRLSARARHDAKSR
jgi:hypothetical protein